MPQKRGARAAPSEDMETSAQKRKHATMALYSDPGKGKTRLCASAAEFGKVLIIRSNIDHTDSILAEHRGNVDERVVNDWDDMDKLLDEIRSGLAKKYVWGFLDSISLTQDVLLDDIWDTVIAEKPQRARYGLDKQEYGINMTRIGRWLRHVIGPDLWNFGITAHTERLLSPDRDEDGDPIEKLMPWVQGKQMANKVCGYTNLVAFLDQDTKGRRVLHTSSTDWFYGKNQYEPSGEDWGIVNPTMSDLVARIEKHRGAPLGQLPRAKSTTKRTGAKKKRPKRK